MLRKAVEVVEQGFLLGDVDFDGVGALGLPVRGEDDDGFGFDALGDFEAEGLELGVDGVGFVVHCVGAAVGDKVDWGAFWGGLGCHCP